MVKNKKYIIIALSVLVLIFIGQVIYACTYVGDRTVLYPREEYTYYEIIANKLNGYEDPKTIEMLKEDKLIYEDVHVVSKTKTKVTWSKSKYEDAVNDYLQDELDKID